MEKWGRTHKRHIPVDPHHMDKQRQDNQLEPIYNSSVPIQDVTLKTYQVAREGQGDQY